MHCSLLHDECYATSKMSERNSAKQNESREARDLVEKWTKGNMKVNSIPKIVSKLYYIEALMR